MAAGEAQLTEAQRNMEQPAAVNELMTRFLAGLPAPATEGLSEQTEELTERGDGQWSR
jgi:hypothetical protein